MKTDKIIIAKYSKKIVAYNFAGNDNFDWDKGVTIEITSVCLSCGKFFISSRTFFSKEEAFFYNPIYCHNCNVFTGYESKKEILDLYKNIKYIIECKECHNPFELSSPMAPGSYYLLPFDEIIDLCKECISKVKPNVTLEKI